MTEQARFALLRLRLLLKAPKSLFLAQFLAFSLGKNVLNTYISLILCYTAVLSKTLNRLCEGATATAAIYLPPRERRACVSEIAILGRSPTTTEADCFVVPPCMMVLGGNAEQSRSLRSVFFLLLFLLCMGVGMWITPLGFESFRAFSRGGVR